MNCDGLRWWVDFEPSPLWFARVKNQLMGFSLASKQIIDSQVKNVLK